MTDTATQIGQMFEQAGTGPHAGSPPPAAPPVGNEPPSAPPGQGSDQPPAAPQQQAPAEPDYSLASDFLQQVPEADRPLLEKYVKQWDAGVTRRFQGLHEKYQPYEQLGDPEVLQQAIQVMSLLEESPETIYQILLEDVQKGAEWTQRLQGQVPQQQPQSYAGQTSGEDPLQGLPPEVAARLDSQQQMLEHLATIIVGNQQAEVAQQEDQVLEEYLGNLRTEFQSVAQQFGDFDEDYVLARMERGEDGAEAVKAFYGMIQQRVNSALAPQQNLPPVLSGTGAPPVETQRIQDLDTKSTRNLVADLLAQTSASGK